MTRNRLAAAAIAAQAAFVIGWIVLGVLEGHGYSAGRHDVSDLGALTAHHTTSWALVEVISGVTTMVFALWALRPALIGPGQGSTIGAWLVAASLPALDNLGDPFFRLDCRAADVGCSMSQATTSWHGKAHLVLFAVAVLPTVVAPFVLGRRMKQLDAWRDLARPARVFGVVVILGLVGNAATSGTAVQGWAQRALIVVVCSGIVVLAARCRTEASRPVRELSHAAAFPGHAMRSTLGPGSTHTGRES
jgi:hypothetical protein